MIAATNAGGPAPRERPGPGTGGKSHADQRLPEADVNGRPEERTKYPGIYRRGTRYVIRYRDAQGRSRKRAARTLSEARQLKPILEASVIRGEHRELTRVTFGSYALDWADTYQGRTGRGIRPETRSDYRKNLERNAIPFLGRMRMSEIEPRDIRAFVKHVADRGVAANTVRLALAPVKAVLATAVEDGLIRWNPSTGVRLATGVNRDQDERVKAPTVDEYRKLLGKLPPENRLLVEFLAHTGVRIGECLALRWSDVDFGGRRVRIRRRLYRGGFAPPKSRYGRREIPLTDGMSRRLWELRKTTGGKDTEPVFASSTGGYLDPGNLHGRVLKPAARSAGIGWLGFHSLRHFCATSLFRNGLNAAQVQRWLGHHSPTFTIATYVHLLPEDLPTASFMDTLLPIEGDTCGDTRPDETDREGAGSATVEPLRLQAVSS
jgi:integrase